MIIICKFNEIMKKVTKSVREIEKSLAGIEELFRKAARELRSRNRQDR